MEPFTLGSIIAALVGAAGTYMGNQQAAKAVNRATNNAMMNQAAYADKIRQRAAERADDYEIDKRKAEQEAITEDLAQDYTAQPTSAVSIAQEASKATGDVSSDYDEAKAISDARVKNSINTFGNLLANVHGAKNMRQRENWANADAANQISAQQALMRSQNILDNYKIQNASTKGNGLQTLGSLAGLTGTVLGTAGMVNTLANLGKQTATQGLNLGGNIAGGMAKATANSTMNPFGNALRRSVGRTIPSLFGG